MRENWDLSDGVNLLVGASRSDFRIEPLPWPKPGITGRAARRRHGHRCAACGAGFLCRGPGETGYCAPICPPCYWIELGSQLRLYLAVANSLERKRAKLERRLSPRARRAARQRRREFQERGGIVAGLDTVVLQARQAESEKSQAPCPVGERRNHAGQGRHQGENGRSVKKIFSAQRMGTNLTRSPTGCW